MWDQIAVCGHSDTQVVEYIDFLSEAQLYPVTTKNGHYVTPRAPGWGLEFMPEFLAAHTYPSGAVWVLQSLPPPLLGILQPTPITVLSQRFRNPPTSM